MKTSRIRARAGFTMIEMLVAMCVVAILLALAGPFLTNMGAAQQVRTASYDVYSTLTQARSEALTRNTLVTVAPISGNWAQGWTMTQADGTVLRRQSAYPNIALTGPAQIIYSGEGRPSTTATPFLFSAGNVTSEAWRCLRVRLNGRASISRGPCP